MPRISRVRQRLHTGSAWPVFCDSRRHLSGGCKCLLGLHLVPRTLFIATNYTYFCKRCKVRYVTCAPPPFPTYQLRGAPGSFLHFDTICGSAGSRLTNRLSYTKNRLSSPRSACYKARPEEVIMQILSFFVFVVLAGLFVLAVGYGFWFLQGRDDETDG
jgi:hypothetical protein